MITVDLGIVNEKEVELAKKLGLKVIVTDHHQLQKERLPQCLIIHPDLPDQKYPNKNLSGGAVAWKLAFALCQKIHNSKFIIHNFPLWVLDLAAISIVCDCLPLIGENRVLVKYGLKVLSQTQNRGLKSLYEVAAIDKDKINTYTLGFQIGPRINAPGRMSRLKIADPRSPMAIGASGDHATAAFYLLVSDKKKETQEIAQKLNEINLQRQNELEKTLKEAGDKIKTRQLEKEKFILVEGDNWNLGLVGLVAGKLAEEFHRPVIVLAKELKQWRGSARSIEGFDIMESLAYAKDYLIKHGGHKAAAGVTLELEYLQNLYDKLLEFSRIKLKDEDLIPKLKIDAEIKAEDVDFKLVNKLKDFEPHGLGNPRPVFLLKDVEVKDIHTVGTKNKHLKLLLKPLTQNSILKCIAFDWGFLAEQITIGKKIDIVFTVAEDEWSGNKKIQLQIIDLRLR